jgi:transporter family-2 protein
MIALQARANGELSHRLDNAPQAAFVSFSSGLFFVAIYALFSPSVKAGISRLRSAVRNGNLPRWRLLAGALGGSFVALQTSVVPFIGVAMYSVASLAGQTATSLIVDRIGLTGGGPKLISLRRVSAALITVIAVLVSVFDKLEAHSFSFIAVGLAVIAGALVGVQRALNGQINEHSQQSYTTSLLNFITGTSFLAIFILILVLVGKIELQPLPNGPWWIYTGGIIGVIYIAATSLIASA